MTGPKLVLTALLLGFDAWALWLGLHPHVSRAYRAAYISHTIGLDEYVAAERRLHPQPGAEADMPPLR